MDSISVPLMGGGGGANEISLDNLPDDALGISLISGLDDMIGGGGGGGSKSGSGGSGGGGGSREMDDGIMNLESLDKPLFGETAPPRENKDGGNEANRPIKLSSFDMGGGGNRDGDLGGPTLTSLDDIGATARAPRGGDAPERPLTAKEMMREKYELLAKFDGLVDRGIINMNEFNKDSDLDEMRAE